MSIGSQVEHRFALRIEGDNIDVRFVARVARPARRVALLSRPCEMQTDASSHRKVTADKRVRAVLAVAPGVFGDVSNAPSRPTANMANADKAQKIPCRPRRVMARSSQRML